MKVVLDTNIFIDSFFKACKDCRLVLRKEHNGEFKLVMSHEMNEELLRILTSMIGKLELEHNETVLIYKVLLRALLRTELIDPKTKFDKCEDPDDNMFVACAIDGNATYIISKDAHLHNLKEHHQEELKNKNKQNIKIMYPDEFLLELDKIKLAANFNKR